MQYQFIAPYHKGGVAVRGSSEFAYNFQGYQFWFSSEKNRNLFIGDPWKYAPAWGGFCSWGIGLELPPRWPWQVDFLGPPASPWEGWFIVDGVLMFNIWSSYTDRFLENSESNLKLAAERWKSLFNGHLHAGPFNTHCIGHGPLKNWCLSQQPSPWTKPLPSCDVNVIAGNYTAVDPLACKTQAESGNLISDDCRKILEVDGGGIVSGANDFDSFGNQSVSPHSVRTIKICASVGFSVLVLLTVYCCRKRLARCFCKAKSKERERFVDGEIAKVQDGSQSTGSFDAVEQDIGDNTPIGLK